MNRRNTSSWFPMTMFDKTASKDVLFGPCLQPETLNYPYPKEKVKKNETVIWSPLNHKTVSLKSYEKAHQTNDIEALGKISKIGISLGCTFGNSIDLNPRH